MQLATWHIVILKYTVNSLADMPPSHAINVNLIYSSHLYEFIIWKWLKCTENWTGNPLLHLLPPGDLALWKVANKHTLLQWYCWYCQAALVSPTLPLRFWACYMSWAYSITTHCTCMNNTSCNQPKVVLEPEIQAPRGKEWQHGVDGTWAAGSMCHCCQVWMNSKM